MTPFLPVTSHVESPRTRVRSAALCVAPFLAPPIHGAHSPHDTRLLDGMSGTLARNGQKSQSTPPAPPYNPHSKLTH
jgi:hypothetical protein